MTRTALRLSHGSHVLLDHKIQNWTTFKTHMRCVLEGWSVPPPIKFRFSNFIFMFEGVMIPGPSPDGLGIDRALRSKAHGHQGTLIGTRYMVPGTWYQVPRTWYQVPPGTWYLVHGTRYLSHKGFRNTQLRGGPRAVHAQGGGGGDAHGEARCHVHTLQLGQVHELKLHC